MTFCQFFTLIINSTLKKKKNHMNHYLATHIINILPYSDLKMPIPMPSTTHTDCLLNNCFLNFYLKS